MDATTVMKLAENLARLPDETEWVEFKADDDNPEDIGEYISALSNSAVLVDKEHAYVVWGIEDKTHKITGTKFDPKTKKVGDEELENWLSHLLEPCPAFAFHEANPSGTRVVILEIPRASNTPVAFKGIRHIRCGSYKKKLKEHPEKERALWLLLSAEPFEKRIALGSLRPGDVARLIDFQSYFHLTGMPLPSDVPRIIEGLASASLVTTLDSGDLAITNLGAILFAKDLREFSDLSKKALRVVSYRGKDRSAPMTQMEGRRGYAAGFDGAMGYLMDLFPENEIITSALRTRVKLYPLVAVRELLANALVHQNFDVSGAGPLVEVFSDRLEITNPGLPLIETLRFADAPPRARNAMVTDLMRKARICEELGGGIDRALGEVEIYQLPAPDFTAAVHSTRVVLYGPMQLSRMRKDDKIRACYWHSALLRVRNEVMTNRTLRKRFAISERNYTMATRIINDTLDKGLIKPYDQESTSRRLAAYVPFWA